jgi:hypothetical protein
LIKPSPKSILQCSIHITSESSSKTHTYDTTQTKQNGKCFKFLSHKLICLSFQTHAKSKILLLWHHLRFYNNKIAEVPRLYRGACLMSFEYQSRIVGILFIRHWWSNNYFSTQMAGPP